MFIGAFAMIVTISRYATQTMGTVAAVDNALASAEKLASHKKLFVNVKAASTNNNMAQQNEYLSNGHIASVIPFATVNQMKCQHTIRIKWANNKFYGE